MDSIPVALKPLIRRLESVPGLSREDLISVLFVVRLGDSLHRNFYGTFLTKALVQQLTKKLGIPDLVLEVNVFSLRWNFRQGTVSVVHRILYDYDMYSVSVLSNKIARSVLKDKITPKQGLKMIRDLETKTDYCFFESFYREFPGRLLIMPFLAASCATVFYGGTWYDFGFAALCGLVSGIVSWIGTFHEQLEGAVEYLAAMLTAMIAMASVTFFPESTCFSSQVLGGMFWFLYGTSYVVSIFEITNNQIVTGTTRFFKSLVRSYGIAFGAMLGAWLSFYGGEGRYEALRADCKDKSDQISHCWFFLLFPMAGIAGLMQWRVEFNHFLPCLLVQMVAVGSQYVIGTVWKQPEFLANMIPAFLTTLASHVCVVVMRRLHWLGLEESDGETTDAVNENANNMRPSLRKSSSNIIHFVNSGWAETNSRGYAPEDHLTYARSDTWFMILPALYLLVPGSKLMQGAFTELMDSISVTGHGENALDLGPATSLIGIGLAQAIGLRLGFVTLWILNGVWNYMMPCEQRASSSMKDGTNSDITDSCSDSSDSSECLEYIEHRGRLDPVYENDPVDLEMAATTLTPTESMESAVAIEFNV